MKHYESFNFDGVSSLDMGVWRVHEGSGLLDESIFSSRTIEKDASVEGRVSYLSKTTQENIKIDLTLYLEDGVSETKLDEIKGWLVTDYYRPFYFEEQPNRICYVMLEGEITMKHDGVNGYINVTMSSSSKQWFGQEVIVDAGTSKVFDVISKGSTRTMPLMSITSMSNHTSSSPVRIKNVRTNEELIIKTMVSGETLTVDCLMENVKTSLPNIYRFDDVNDVYPSLRPGLNQFTVVGNVQVVIRYRDTYL